MGRAGSTISCTAGTLPHSTAPTREMLEGAGEKHGHDSQAVRGGAPARFLDGADELHAAAAVKVETPAVAEVVLLADYVKFICGALV